MSQVCVTELRYAAVAVPDYDAEVAFYEDIWGLKRIATDGKLSFFAAQGSPEQYVLRIRQADEKRVDLIGLGVPDVAGIDALADQLARDGVKLASQPAKLHAPGGGYGFRLFDPDGRVVEVSSDVEGRPYRVLERRESIPARLSHVVFNSPNPLACVEFYQDKLGFKLSGWLGDFFGFLRCTPEFHNLAFVQADRANLHHISFELRGYDEYLRGVGRLIGAGVPMPWGMGKHTPADSSFAYFLDPNGNTSEYTAPQEKIVDDQAYKPKTWTREENVLDVWGTSSSRNMPEGLDATAANRPPDPGLWIAPPV